MGKFLVLRKDGMEGSAAKFVYNFLHEISAEAQSYSQTDLFSEIEADSGVGSISWLVRRGRGPAATCDIYAKIIAESELLQRPLMRFISFASNIGPAAAVPAGPAPTPLAELQC